MIPIDEQIKYQTEEAALANASGKLPHRWSAHSNAILVSLQRLKAIESGQVPEEPEIPTNYLVLLPTGKKEFVVMADKLKAWRDYIDTLRDLLRRETAKNESALLQAREEGRREGMREAAEICGNLTFTTEISELIGMTKKQMAERACLECQKAITRASEGK